jgi:tetratricopeptide (TPR) repeat protein
MESVSRWLRLRVAEFFRILNTFSFLGSIISRHNAVNIVLGAYGRGDYEGALKAAEALKTIGNSDLKYYFFRGTMQMQLGRYEEAEDLLRRSAIQETDHKQAAVSYCELGSLLCHLSRYDEALEYFHAALAAWPDRASTNRHLAEAWLRKGERSAEAVTRATRAVECERKGALFSNNDTQAINLAENLATLAWAVAVDSRDQGEVIRLASEAQTAVGNDIVPAKSQVEYHLGRAYQALGLRQRASQHYQNAASIDPHGMWGRAAKTLADPQRQRAGDCSSN